MFNVFEAFSDGDTSDSESDNDDREHAIGIGGIWNGYGRVEVKEFEGMCFWRITGCGGWEWEEIPREMFDIMLKFQAGHQNAEHDEKHRQAQIKENRKDEKAYLLRQRELEVADELAVIENKRLEGEKIIDAKYRTGSDEWCNKHYCGRMWCFSYSYNRTIDHLCMSGMQVLTFGDAFNHPIDSLAGCLELRELKFGEKFNRSVDALSKLTTLRELTFGDRFNQDVNCLIDVVKELRVFQFCGEDFEGVVYNFDMRRLLEGVTRKGKVRFHGGHMNEHFWKHPKNDKPLFTIDA